MSTNVHEVVDVAVVGAGLAGAFAALELARRGVARVALLERDIAFRSPGGAHGVVIPTLLFDPQVEVAEHSEARRAAARACAARSRELIGSLLAGRALARVHVDRDGRTATVDTAFVFDADELAAALRRAIAHANVALAEHDAVTELRAVDDGVDVVTASGITRATRVVLAIGAWAPAFDAWLRTVSIAGRVQHARASLPAAHDRVVTVGPGVASIAPSTPSAWSVAEGPQPTNRGDPFDAAPEAVGQSRLDAALALAFPGEPVRIDARGSRPLLFTCDGAPLLGPHPGRASVLVACGFNGLDAAFAPAAGMVAAEWIVDGKPRDAFAVEFSARRQL